MVFSITAGIAICIHCFVLGSFASALSVPRISFVTGANGYVGKEVVWALLREGRRQQQEQQRIVCCVRPTSVNKVKDYWKGEPCVSVEPYDMLDGGVSLERALLSSLVVTDAAAADDDDDAEDCCVFHVASVFGPTQDHRETALENVQGTVDLMHAVSKCCPRGCRVVLTSSMAAVRATGQTPKNTRCYTHEDWNTGSELGKNWGNSYQWSKAESERRAWELSKELNIPMVSLCPAFVFGPSFDGDTVDTSNSYSITLVKQWISGESEVQSRLCVDVRDLARAQVEAAQRPNAVGKRFLVSAERRLTSETTAEALKVFSPNPEKITFDADFDGGAIKIGEIEVECVERLKEELGVELTPIDQTFRDMAQVLAEQDLKTSS